MYLAARVSKPCSINLKQAQPKADTKSRVVAPVDPDRFKQRIAEMPAPPCDALTAVVTLGNRREFATPSEP